MSQYNDISIRPFSSSTKQEHFLLSYKGKYYEASHAIVGLLTELQQNDTQEKAIEAYILKRNGKYTVEQVEDIIKKHINPLFSAPKEKKRTFLYEKELLSSAAVDHFSDAFCFLFRKEYRWIFLAVAVVLDVYFFISTPNLLVFNNTVNAYTVAGLFVFMLLSSFFHELGHASACKYYGVHHGGIGFGLYLNFPVLYTDVTEVWKLNRKQRLVVNIAGVYFQSFFLIALLAGFLITGYDMLRYIVLILNLGFIMTLNPFFKFDGYWIVSDLLGVPSLRSRSKELLRYCWRRFRRKPTGDVPYLLRISRAEKWGLAVYAVVVNLFMGYYFFYIIPNFVYRFIQSFPGEVHELILYLSNSLMPPFALLRNIGMQLVFLALLGFLFTNMIRSLRKRNVKNKR